MNETTKSDTWLDFAEIKHNADTIRILQGLGLLDSLDENGDELVGWCPIGTRKHGKRDSFHVYVDRKTFKCFACKNRGSLLDLVARVRELPLRQAAEHVVAIMNSTDPAAASDTDQVNRVMDADIVHSLVEAMDARTAVTPADSLGDQFSITLSLKDAIQLVKQNRRDPAQLVVLDVAALRALHQLIS